MSRDLYAALSGANAAWTRLELVANNLANAATPGFRAGRVAFSLEGAGEHALSDSYAEATPIQQSQREGAVQLDGNPLHLALRGPGFFAVQAGAEEMYTRDGSFTLSTEGQLVTADGYPVLAEGGPINLPPGEQLQVDSEGILRGSESGEIGRLRIVDGPMQPVRDNLWQARGEPQPADADVIQGGIEGSNVQPMEEMVHMIEASRAFEAFQRAMQTSDELDQRLNRMGNS